jgi:hypothetical protein
MSLQLHRPDGKGGLEVRTGEDQEWRSGLRSTRWGASLKGGKLPAMKNTEMNPASTARSVALWVGLALVTFALIVAGYSAGLWSLPKPGV